MSSGRGDWAPRGFVLAQAPNAPLAVALAAGVAARLVSGDAHGYLSAIHLVFLGVWAYLEASAGANWFRRALGIAFLVYVVVRVGGEL